MYITNRRLMYITNRSGFKRNRAIVAVEREVLLIYVAWSVKYAVHAESCRGEMNVDIASFTALVSLSRACAH